MFNMSNSTNFRVENSLLRFLGGYRLIVRVKLSKLGT